MVGGGKAGNIISPNPNTIAAANNLNVPLTSLMGAGLIPSIFGIIVAIILSKRLINKGSFVKEEELSISSEEKPKLFASIIGPLVAILLFSSKTFIRHSY